MLCETSGPLQLDAVACYRHLGSVLMHNGSLVTEARTRIQHGWHLFREGRRTVFCTPRISLPKRVLLFRAHVLAAVFSGAGAWPSFCNAGWRVLEAGYFCMLRAMLRIPRDADQHWSADRVLSTVGLPCLRGLISAERIRFLAQLWRSGLRPLPLSSTRVGLYRLSSMLLTGCYRRSPRRRPLALFRRIGRGGRSCLARLVASKGFLKGLQRGMWAVLARLLLFSFLFQHLESHAGTSC